MSRQHQKEIVQAAQAAAIDAAAGERHRCLWILQELVSKAEKAMDRKLLTPSELQLVRVRLEVTRTVAQAARTLILSGIRPPRRSNEQAKAQGPQAQFEGGVGSPPDHREHPQQRPQGDDPLQEAPQLQSGRLERLEEGDQRSAAEGQEQAGAQGQGDHQDR